MAVEFVALLTNETVPEALPVVCGANVMVTFWLAPAAIAIGKVDPVRLKPDPVKFAADTEIDDVPVLESFTVWFEVFPIRTLPKATLVGDALSRNVGAAVAVPERANRRSCIARIARDRHCAAIAAGSRRSKLQGKICRPTRCDRDWETHSRDAEACAADSRARDRQVRSACI